MLADPMVGYWCRVGSVALTHTRTDIFGAVAIWDQRRTMLSIFVVPPTARLHQGCWLCFIRELPGLVAAPPGVRAGLSPVPALAPCRSHVLAISQIISVSGLVVFPGCFRLSFTVGELDITFTHAFCLPVLFVLW